MPGRGQKEPISPWRTATCQNRDQSDRVNERALIAAGPIMGALAGLGIGGLVGALVGMGIPEYEAKRYEGRIKDGGVLLSVHCDTSDEISRAKDLLKQTGAEDISSTGEASSDQPATVAARRM